MDQALTTLENLVKYPELNREEFIIIQSHLREQLGNANVTVLEAFEAVAADGDTGRLPSAASLTTIRYAIPTTVISK